MARISPAGRRIQYSGPPKTMAVTWQRKIFEIQTDRLRVRGHHPGQIFGTAGAGGTFQVDKFGDMDRGVLISLCPHLSGRTRIVRRDP